MDGQCQTLGIRPRAKLGSVMQKLKPTDSIIWGKLMSGSCGGVNDVGRGQRADKQSRPCYRAVIQFLTAHQLGYTFLSFQKIWGILWKMEGKTDVTQAHIMQVWRDPTRLSSSPLAQNRYNLRVRWRCPGLLLDERPIALRMESPHLSSAPVPDLTPLTGTVFPCRWLRI